MLFDLSILVFVLVQHMFYFIQLVEGMLHDSKKQYVSLPIHGFIFHGFSYPQSENIKWESPEINNSEILNCPPFWVMKSHAIPPGGPSVIPLPTVSMLYMSPAC